MGDLTGARRHFEGALTRYREEDFVGTPFTVDPGMGSLVFSGQNEWALGYSDVALQHVNEAVALARRQNSPAAVAFALSISAGVHAWRRDLKRVREVCDEAIRLAIESGFPQTNAVAKIWNAWARAQMGESDDAVEQIREGLADFDAQQFYLARAAFLRLLSETQAVVGATDDALVTAEQAVQAGPDELLHRPFALLLRGELQLRRDPGSKAHSELAEHDFREALELARSMGAKSVELRATTSLARLLDKQGYRYAVRAMLADIYNWFTEGFDTADLKDAKALLDELGT